MKGQVKGCLTNGETSWKDRNWRNDQVPIITNNSAECDEGKQTRLEEAKWNNVFFVEQTTDHAGNIGAFTMSYMCMECRHMPKDHVSWFAVDCHGKRQKASKMVARIWRANFGAGYDNHYAAYLWLQEVFFRAFRRSQEWAPTARSGLQRDRWP